MGVIRGAWLQLYPFSDGIRRLPCTQMLEQAQMRAAGLKAGVETRVGTMVYASKTSVCIFGGNAADWQALHGISQVGNLESLIYQLLAMV